MKTKSLDLPNSIACQTGESEPMSMLIESCQPFKVRTSCGHIVIRKMRESTAGVPYTPDTVLDAPNGRPCPDCEAK